MAPFLADKQLSQQGFLSSEPYVIMQAGVQPVVHLIADAGFDNYQTTINISQQDGRREEGRGAALRQRLGSKAGPNT